MYLSPTHPSFIFDMEQRQRSEMKEMGPCYDTNDLTQQDAGGRYEMFTDGIQDQRYLHLACRFIIFKTNYINLNTSHSIKEA
jgi:hypothetical protein